MTSKPELVILKLLLENSIYNKYIQYININKEEIELYTIYNKLSLLHDKYKRNLSLEELELTVLDSLTEKEKDVYTGIFESIRTVSVSEDLISDLLVSIKQKNLASKIALTALEITEGKPSLEKLDTLYNQFHEEIQNEPDEFTTDSLEQIYYGAVQTPGLRWRLHCLNISLGSLRRGDFGFIFARPETGKTTFLASEVTCMATQTDRPILWFNNEEQGEKVKLRCYQATLNLNLTELFHDLPNNQQRYIDITGGNIKIRDRASIHRREVEHYCRRLSPALVIFDQIDKIKGFDGERDDLKHGALYQWARELSKEYCPVIGVCQADVGGEGKKWLTMDNVSLAKTSKQAEADWILGIGKTHNIEEERIRFLNISKNKLLGDPDSKPEERHGRYEVQILPEYARYKDI